MLAAAWVTGAAAQPPPAGPPVVRIEVRSDAPLADPEELVSLLAIALGQPLAPQAVRRTLRNLHATGAASEIELYSEPAAGGVAAILVLWAAVQVEEVRLRGELGLREADLRAALVVREAEPLIESRVLRSVYALQDLLRARGYFRAAVRVQVATDPATQRAVVTFEIEAGERAAVGEVVFEGDFAPFEPAQLVAAMSSRPGELYDAAAVREDAERLHRFLLDQGHRLAVVEPPAEEFVADTGGVQLVVRLRAGPRLEFEVAGADRRELERRDLLPFLGDDGYDEALVLQGIDRVRSFYQERGHHRVAVERQEERTAEALRLRLEIVPGPEYVLEEVRFAGNLEIAEERLAELMTTSARRLLRPGSGRLVDAVLADDLANLRSFYALQGYRSARVGPQEVTADGERLTLTIPVLEGPRTVVRSLGFEGIEGLDLRRVRAAAALREDGPFHSLLLDETLNSLRALYEDQGFQAAQVSPALEWNEERTAVDVVVRVLEGPRSRVDRVVLRGNRRTDPQVLRRFVDLVPGEPVSRRRLLDLQRRLYRLGIFTRVDVTLAPAADEAGRDVLVRVEEGKTRRVFYELGYDSEDGARAGFGIGESNLFGRALGVQIDARASQRDQQYRALVSQPYLGRWPVPVTYSIFRTQEERESFESRRRGTVVEAERVFERRRFGLLYNYRIVDLELRETGAAVDVQRELLDIKISSLTPSLLVDHRDDPLNPTRGWSSAVQLEVASPLFLADEAFLKLFLQGSWQRRLSGGVLAASLRLGGIEALADSATPDPSLPVAFPSAEVPISERFFAGGRTTHRAYERDFLGIRGETLCARAAAGEPECGDQAASFAPVGGNGLALVNLDYRFPIAGDFGGIAFLDAGNVWADWRDLDWQDAKLGAGLGARYLSPIGPLRLEIGWKLDREPGESAYEIFLSFGNPF
jgi:outer membrane protein insertion porin family